MRRDADPLILNLDPDRGNAERGVVTIHGRGTDGDRAVIGRKLHRVRKKVEDDLLELRGVGFEQRQTVLDLGSDLDVSPLGLAAHDLANAGDHLDDRKWLWRDLHPPRFDLREVEKIVDQGQQVLAAAQDVAQEVVMTIIDAIRQRLVEDRRESDDRVQGSPELVAHAREKLTLQPVRLLDDQIRSGELSRLLLELLGQPGESLDLEGLFGPELPDETILLLELGDSSHRYGRGSVEKQNSSQSRRRPDPESIELLEHRQGRQVCDQIQGHHSGHARKTPQESGRGDVGEIEEKEEAVDPSVEVDHGRDQHRVQTERTHVEIEGDVAIEPVTVELINDEGRR